MLLQLAVSGSAMGLIYGMIALSFALIYSGAGVVNFATGDFAMVPAIIVAVLLLRAHWGFLPAYVVGIVLWCCGGLVFYRLVYHPLRNRSSYLTVAIATLGVAEFLRNVVQMVFGAEPMAVRSPSGLGVVRVAGVSVGIQNVIIVVVTGTLLVTQYLLFEKTLLGKKMRATAQDREMARLCGINADRMLAFTFGYAAALGAVAGILVSPLFNVSPQMGSWLGLKAFAVSVLGGFGSVPGAIIGGLVVGLLEIFGAAFVSGGYKDAFAFILMIAILLVRPQGLFGEQTAERA